MRRQIPAAVAVLATLAGCAQQPNLPSAGARRTAPSTRAPARPRHSRGESPAPPSRRRTGDCSASGRRQVLVSLGGGPHSLTAVQFVSPSRGWAVGFDRILATTDGGARWTVQRGGRMRLTSVDFVDSEDGWAVGAGTLLATRDGGARWAPLPEPCPRIRSVHFVSPSTGFAVAGGSGIAYLNSTLAPRQGGVLLTTADGGRTWRRLPAPPDTQSACFGNPRDGWLGSDGRLYRSTDGGASWSLAAAGPRPPQQSPPYTMIVQCAGADAWGVDLGFGAGMSQSPHVGYHAAPSGAVPIFAEQHFPHPGAAVTADAPGSIPGPFSAISGSTAVFFGFCPPCGYGTAPWDVAGRGGAVLRRRGDAGDVRQAVAASFLSPRMGWVVGIWIGYPSRRQVERIVATADGGRTWQVEYQSG